MPPAYHSVVANVICINLVYVYDIEKNITDKLCNRYARLLWRSSPSIQTNLADRVHNRKWRRTDEITSNVSEFLMKLNILKKRKYPMRSFSNSEKNRVGSMNINRIQGGTSEFRPIRDQQFTKFFKDQSVSHIHFFKIAIKIDCVTHILAHDHWTVSIFAKPHINRPTKICASALNWREQKYISGTYLHINVLWSNHFRYNLILAIQKFEKRHGTRRLSESSGCNTRHI